MKRLLLFVLLLLPLLSEGQAGYLNLNDFGPPTYTYPYSRFWLRGTTPAGSVAVFTIHGTLSYIIHTDTVFIPALATRDDATPYKLVWIDASGMLRAITPPYLYISDTANMLSPYIKAIDTTGHWAPKLPYLLSESDPVWVAASSNYFTKSQSDARYLQSTDTSSMLTPYLRKIDTTAMLSKYQRKQDTIYMQQRINLKVNISDTSAMLTPYAKIFQLVPKMNVSDTASMLSPYVKSFQLTPKLNVSDTASMLSPYLKSFLLRKTETFSGTTDASGNYTVTFATAYPTAPDIQSQLTTGVVTQTDRVTAISTTGFTVNVTNRAVTTLLGVDLISGTATAVNGATVTVLITAR